MCTAKDSACIWRASKRYCWLTAANTSPRSLRPYGWRVRSAAAQRDVVEQRVRGIGGIAVVVDVEPEDDGLSRPLARVPRHLRPRAGIRADVQRGRERRSRGVPDLHLDLVVR